MLEDVSILALQQYWWFITSLIGGVLAFLLFVQGGQTLVLMAGKTDIEHTMMINALGHKWCMSLAAIVAWIGVFFAAFPLFYATSFYGAYWIGAIIILCFFSQSVSYEFRNKTRNLLGDTTYEWILLIGGLNTAFFLGVMIATFFTGSPFAIDINPQNGTTSPTWMGTMGGMELAMDFSRYTTFINISLGLAFVFISRILGALYLKKRIDNEDIIRRSSKIVRANLPFFLLFFSFFMCNIWVRAGYEYSVDGYIMLVPYKYLMNMIEMPQVGFILAVGSILMLWGMIWGCRMVDKHGFYLCGGGFAMVICALLLSVGLNGTVFYPAFDQWIQNGLTIENSSSSHHSLSILTYISFGIPFISALIAYAWYQMDKKPLNKKNIKKDYHAY